MRISIIITALSIANPAWTQPAPVRKGEKVKLAPAVVPQIFTATAAEKDGKVVVRMSAPALRLMAKKIGGKTVTRGVICWEEQKPLILGKHVRAFNTAGRSLDNQSVVKALALPSAVACFIRRQPDDPERPDPFYAGVFRADIVFLVFEGKDLLR